MDNIPYKTRIWPLAVVGLVILAGFIYWDFARHERVKQFVGRGPDIPGAAVPAGPGTAAEFQRVKAALTQTVRQGDVTIQVTWDTPEFFRALAAAEAAQDIPRHEVLYHEYAERFGLHRDLVFNVIVASDSVDLRGYPIQEHSRLRNDQGNEVAAGQWREARGSSARRLEGVLSFPQRTAAGQMMIGHLVGEHLPEESPAAALELALTVLPAGAPASFRWSVASGGEAAN